MDIMSRLTTRFGAALLAGFGVFAVGGSAHADEGGVSFWLPGNFGSLAAAPGTPGWNFASIYYHSTVSAGGGKQFAFGGGIQAGLKANADLVFVNGTYIFPTPVLGAQASLGMAVAVGNMAPRIDATLTGPNGGVVSGSRSDSLFSYSDLYPTGSLKWNFGVHNVMVYTAWDIPAGDYQAGRLANIGIGHWAADAGAGYTYFNPATGHEFSVVTGLTYNFENPDTNYKNGIDWHVDWAASQFLSKQIHVGLVGYWYQQITGDSGSGATLGPFKSRVGGIGPQIGYIFPVSESYHGYLNLKGYKEFSAENRPVGWNVWLTFALSTGPPTPASPVKR
jgi:hypothetical protein